MRFLGVFCETPFHQGASRAAPEKSGLHACGQADRVIALESWEGLGPQDALRRTLEVFLGLERETLVSLDLYRVP